MRRLLIQLSDIIDDRAKLFELLQCALYSILAATGCLYLFVYDGPPSAVQQVLNWATSYQLWCWMHVAGSLMCLAGKASRLTPRLEYSGLWATLGGNAMVGIAVFQYCAGAFALWGNGTCTGAISGFIVAGAVLIITHDMRQIIKLRRA